MACYAPLSGYRTPEGKVTFDRTLGYCDTKVTVSCGQCWGCRLERSRQWAVRIQHESAMHDTNSFLTLTYDQDELPDHGTLVLAHWQNFAKRFRKKLGPFRFYHCGEYGELTGRPHYHAAIFGHDFVSDRTKYKKIRGNQTYTSPLLDELWGHGLAVIGSLTFQSAAYVARYIMKKVTGPRAAEHYETSHVDTATGECFSLKPEYTTMSRRPGVGKSWFDKFHKDVFPNDSVISNHHHSRPPKFYDYQFELKDPVGHALVKHERVKRGRKHRKNNTPERLKVRETCAIAKLQSLSRDTI